GQKVTKYKYIGLWLFVAIPLPGTGAWTGSLAAAFLDTRLKKALPAVVLGVITAGCIMLALTHVGINLFSTALA
ncbi:MAG: small multi-drug export protein, partial [Oscillospiraceae bacterium]|nr:small multi-drug export protein [Oscillospiraceae bacterium]